MLKLVPSIDERQPIPAAYHDKIGQWGIRTTLLLITNRFWWSNIYKEVQGYVNSNDQYQVMSSVPKYYYDLGTPQISTFDVFSLNITGPFQRTARGNKYLYVYVEHLTGRPLVGPTDTTTTRKVIMFTCEEISVPLEKLRVIITAKVA